MAEIPRFLVTGQTPRPPGTARPGRRQGRAVPLARLPIATAGATARAVGEGATVLGRIGEELLETIQAADEKLARAQGVILGKQAEGRVLTFMQDTGVGARQSQFIDIESFRATIEARQQQEAETVPPLARPGFVASTAAALLQQSERFIQENRQRTVKAGTEAFGLTRDLYSVNLSQASSQEEAGDITNRFVAGSMRDFVGTGIVNAATVATAVRQVQVDQVALQVQLSPRVMLKTLKDPEQLLFLTPRERIALIDQAQVERREALNDEDVRNEGIVKLREEGQENRAIEHRKVLYAVNTPSGVLQRQLEIINRQVSKDEVSVGFHKEASIEVRRILSLRIQDPVEDETVKRQLSLDIDLARTPADVANVRAKVRAASGIFSGTLSTYLSRLSAKADRAHVSNEPAVRAGQDLITLAAFPAGRRAINLERRGNKTQLALFAALELYRKVINDIEDSAGGRGEVLARAQEEALRIRNLYFKDVVGKAPPVALPAEFSGIPLDEALLKVETFRTTAGQRLPRDVRGAIIEALNAQAKTDATTRQKQQDKDAAIAAEEEEETWFNKIKSIFISETEERK